MMHIANVPLAVVCDSSNRAGDSHDDSLVDDIVIEVAMIASDLCIAALDSVTASCCHETAVPAAAAINPTNSRTLSEILGGSRGGDCAGRSGMDAPRH